MLTRRQTIPRRTALPSAGPGTRPTAVRPGESDDAAVRHARTDFAWPASSAEPRALSPRTDAKPDATATPRTRIRALLVEDDASDAALTRTCLSACLGSTILVTHETRLSSALARLAVDPFDLVILDLDLPDSRGLATCERMTGAHPELPVVVLTGVDDEAIGVRAIQRGAQDFLSKNLIDAGGLARAIRHALERHGMVVRLETAARDERRGALRLRNVLARSAEGFLVLDEAGAVILANPAAESLLGLAPGEALGRVLELPIPTGDGHETVIPRDDGTSFPAELRVAALEWEGRAATLVSIHDLSDRKRTERVVVAQTVQRAFLPDRSDRRSGALRMSARHELCEDASGDYYDFIELGGDLVAIAIGDVAGHGLGPALLMAQGRACLRAFCHTSTDLGAILRNVNDALAADMTDGRFMSLFVGIVDVRRGRMLWCNGGHIPPFLKRRGESRIERLGPTGPVLGVRRGSEYAVRETTLRPGDLLVACSDGATEAVSAAGERFGEERVAALLESAPPADAASAVESVREAVRRWTGAAPVHDDLTLVGLELRMPGLEPAPAGRTRTP